jgi:hypothetical protein
MAATATSLLSRVLPNWFVADLHEQRAATTLKRAGESLTDVRCFTVPDSTIQCPLLYALTPWSDALHMSSTFIINEATTTTTIQ